MSASVVSAGGGTHYVWAPSTVPLAAGGTVTWTWTGVHNIAVTGLGGSGGPVAGGSFSLTFSAPGSYAFACEVHAGMAGTVVVQ